MVFTDDENGQILLSGAFLFAIAIAIIAIMLNNVIYSNNVAYIGFSEQSTYGDSSLKQMMIDEIYNEYHKSSGNEAWFTSNMTAFMNAVNNMTVIKGVYIKNVSHKFTNNPHDSQSDVVRQQIYIYGKNFNESYTIGTNYTKPPAATVNILPRNPGNVIIKLGINNTNSYYFAFIIDVTNSTTYLPEPNVSITLNNDGRETRSDPILTDSNGRLIWPTIRTGTHKIYVYLSDSPSQSSNVIIV